MNFLIISHALHKTEEHKIFSYAPYVHEMNLWLKYVDAVTVIAPKTKVPVNAIDMAYIHDSLLLKSIPMIQFTDVSLILKSLAKMPYILFVIFAACFKADHIHLRCPGNIGLLGCLVQIFFPKKIKTAKYAGNWDPNAKQPLSYRFQKWLLSNTLLTKNMSVLVYGQWRNQPKSIKPFFTATYWASEIEADPNRDYSGGLHFVFVGSLVEGKRPLLAIQIVEALHEKGRKVTLDVFGEGVLKISLRDYIEENKLENVVVLHGNQPRENIKKAYKKAHFSLLPSKSEGWPKAVAEAMFFGAIPIATSVSCVPYMLGHGERGVLIKAHLKQDLALIANILEDEKKLKKLSEKASKWSQLYTLDTFESEIAKLLKP